MNNNLFKNTWLARSFLIIFTILFLFVIPPIFLKKNLELASFKVNGVEINLEIADTLTERVRGLSGRQNLNRNNGILFVFQTDGLHRFWMKDMHLAIDIIWLDKNQRIVKILQNIQPESYPESFAPEKESRYVIELPAFNSRDLSLEVGDYIPLEFK